MRLTKAHHARSVLFNVPDSKLILGGKFILYEHLSKQEGFITLRAKF